MTDFYIFTIQESLSKSICEEIIERFEEQSNKREGRTFEGVNKDKKNTTDFHLGEDMSQWKDIDKVLYNELNKAIKNYIDHLNKDIQIFYYSTMNDKGFQIQKYDKGEGHYVFHNDSIIYSDSTYRVFTYLWYLNTIEEGGETDFGIKGLVKPEAGKLILFPSCWTYPHAGKIPISSDKYIITGWVIIPSQNACPN